jgi:O-antigen ligase
MLAGLVLTFTFGAWLALATTTAAFVLLLDKKRRWKFLFTGIAGFAATACVVAYTPALRALVEDKIVSTGMDGLAWDIYSRLQAWTFAIQTWRAHPLFGVGVGNYQAIEYTNQLVASPWAITGSTPHETYLYLLAIGGVVGLVTMLILVGGVIRDNIRLRSDPEYGLIAIGMAFSIAVNMIGSFSDDSPFTGPHASYLLWLMIGLSLAVGNLARTARAPIGEIGSS